MSKFCETSRQLCLLLLIVVVRGGCNTQSHSMSNNNNEYEWVSWLHVTFGNANIQPAKQGRTETKKRRWKSLSKIRILLSYVKKRRGLDAANAEMHSFLLASSLYDYSCISINVYCSIFLAASCRMRKNGKDFLVEISSMSRRFSISSFRF